MSINNDICFQKQHKMQHHKVISTPYGDGKSPLCLCLKQSETYLLSWLSSLSR